MALLRVLLLASLPCLGLTQEERLLIVYPAAPHPQNNLLPQSNEIEDSYTKVSSSKKEATKKPVMRTKSMSSVSTSYSVSSSVSSSQSSRRRGEARKLLLIPPTRCCQHFRNRYICKQPSINKANHLIWFQDSDLQANLTPTPIILADQEVKFNSVNARPSFQQM